MKTRPISPKVHGIADYVLVSSLLTLPSLLGFQNKVRSFYAFETYPEEILDDLSGDAGTVG
ncbi:hypothetical protein [Pedobacter jeongneungensis]|uniref:hypothetical protein n=1 Tax=Pedobacter jeongneungensis TaxID=947309 RepID=UPI000469A677|nr:hypothetical protein [Pedobacter jeongneungensis]